MSLDGLHNLRPIKMNYYTVILLIPHNGNRIVLDGVTAEIETTNWISVSPNPHLDIVLEVHYTSTEQYEQLRKEMFITNKPIYLYFKDVHPNLINVYCKSMTADFKKITIRFIGNTTDKEYLDYVTELENKFNEEVFKIPKPEPDLKLKEKIKILKRKLTF